METCICIFILSISVVVLGLIGVAVFALFCLVKRNYFAHVEIDHAKIAIKKKVIKRANAKDFNSRRIRIFLQRNRTF